jgi:hypothetical protein
MALIELLLMAGWTVVVVRLFAIRATLSDRTLFTYMALGALMALTAAPLAEKFIVPYPLDQYDYPFAGEFLRVAVRNLVLLAPVVTYLFTHRTHRLVSVADAFLLAFALGFGFELVGVFLASSVTHAALRGYTLFPPWQFTWDAEQRFPIFGLTGDFGLAGVGYAIGMVCMVLAATLRFGRRVRYAIAWTVFALLLVTAHEALWARQIITAGQRLPASGFFWLFDWLMFHGKLLAVASLVALAYLSIREARWVANSEGAAPTARLYLLDDCHQRINTLLREGVSAYKRVAEHARLKAQIGLTRAEMMHTVNQNELFERGQLLELKLRRSESAASRTPEEPVAAPRTAWIAVWAAVAAVVLTVVVMPWLPSGLPPYLWKFLLLNFALPLVPPMTLLQLMLVVLLLWWFVMRPGQLRASWDPDAKVRFGGEGALSFAVMGAALLVLFQVPLDNFYPPFSSVSFLNRASFPRFDAPQLAALILLFATVASGITRRPALLWRITATAHERRAAIVRNTLLIVNAGIFMWISVKVYIPMLAAFQKELGPSFFHVFGRLGNVMMALMTTLILFAVSIVLGIVLRKVTRRVEEFLIGTEKA